MGPNNTLRQCPDEPSCVVRGATSAAHILHTELASTLQGSSVAFVEFFNLCISRGLKICAKKKKKWSGRIGRLWVAGSPLLQPREAPGKAALCFLPPPSSLLFVEV